MGRRPFSFFPPVLGVEHNEWIFQKSTWSEILVMNSKSGQEVWVPRRFLGEVSRIDEPVMIVGLRRELEYKAGTLWPYERRVIEMPKAVNDFVRPATEAPPPSSPTMVSSMRMSSDTESRLGILIVVALVLGLLLTFGVVALIHNKQTNIQYVGIVQQSLGLSSKDDFRGIIRKLGEPKEERWRSEVGEIQYRLMHYSDRGIYVILMGQDRDKARYIGAMDENWKPIDAVDPRTRAMLNSLGKF